MTSKEVIKMLEKDGWYLKAIKGSHYHFKHPIKQGKVAVPFHKGDIKIGTLRSIYKQAGLM